MLHNVQARGRLNGEECQFSHGVERIPSLVAKDRTANEPRFAGELILSFGSYNPDRNFVVRARCFLNVVLGSAFGCQYSSQNLS